MKTTTVLALTAVIFTSTTAIAQNNDRYKRDLSQCRKIAENSKSTLGEAAKDGAIGGLGGAALGALTGAATGGNVGKGAAIGAGVGVVGGAAYGTITTEQEKKQVVDNCLRQRGYQIR